MFDLRMGRSPVVIVRVIRMDCVLGSAGRRGVSAGETEQIVLFLDYDGTLSPIVDQPEKAFMTDGMRPVLAEVSNTWE